MKNGGNLRKTKSLLCRFAEAAILHKSNIKSKATEGVAIFYELHIGGCFFSPWQYFLLCIK